MKKLYNKLTKVFNKKTKEEKALVKLEKMKLKYSVIMPLKEGAIFIVPAKAIAMKSFVIYNGRYRQTIFLNDSSATYKEADANTKEDLLNYWATSTPDNGKGGNLLTTPKGTLIICYTASIK